MKLLLALLVASASLAVAPSAAAEPCVGDACVELCYDDPCVVQSATVGSGGVDAGVGVKTFGGFGVRAHAGPDSVYVAYGAGITNCRYGVDLDPLAPIAYCVF